MIVKCLTSSKKTRAYSGREVIRQLWKLTKVGIEWDTTRRRHLTATGQLRGLVRMKHLAFRSCICCHFFRNLQNEYFACIERCIFNTRHTLCSMNGLFVLWPGSSNESSPVHIGNYWYRLVSSVDRALETTAIPWTLLEFF